jgi:hypothetical protein
MTLKIPPALRVFFRGDRIIAWMPRQAQPGVLTVHDFDRLHGLLAGQTQPPPTEAELRALGTAGFLVIPAEGLAAAVPENVKELPAAEEFPADLPPRVRRVDHFCLQPGPAGWLTWSPVLRAYCRLPQALARCVLAAGDGQDLHTLLASRAGDGVGEQAARIEIRRLLAGGLLAGAALPLSDVPVPAAAGDSEPVHLRAGDPWAGLVPDGRRPIYFVTHHIDHLPLALGMLRAQILAHDGGALLEHYLPLPIVSMSVGELQAVYRRFGPGIWLFSNYLWSAEHNLQLSRLVKSVDRRNVTIHGGPSAPKYEEACRRFMQEHSHVDIVVRGAGEATLVQVLEALAPQQDFAALTQVPGITFHADAPAGRPLTRTPDRERLPEVDSLPSPYLTGMFDHYGGQVVAAILETNRGCPYGCTFCDWGSATQEKIRRFDAERVKAEIDWIGRHRIRVLWIADANYGIFARDIEFAQHIADTKALHGYPREVVVNYPKNATEKIARIVKIFVQAGICSQGIVSIQTTDAATLKVIRRDNIKTSKYDELGDIFRREGLPLSTDLMIGLPGATVKSFKADLQYYFDDDVGVKAYRTQLLPNSPMADPDYLRENAIRVDDQRFLVSTSSYTEADLAEMLAIWSAFDIVDGYAVLRYVLRYLQWDHGIAGTDFVHALVREVRADPARYPAIAWLLRHFLQERTVLGGWGPLYQEIGRLAADRFGVAMDSGFATALQVNELLLPRQGRRFPETHTLLHDFVSYFERHGRTSETAGPRLAGLAPGTLVVTDPFGLCELDFRSVEQYDNHQVFYDLPASIARRRSAPNFVRKPA